ncbi:MAG: NUDIX hydrolase [Bacteroidales bacterium]|nr:NUDIX hydrolase [Bacteroidales bacterium]
MNYIYTYPRPSATVDIIVVREKSYGISEILLIKRKFPPFQHMWALPGGFVDENENLSDAAQRELLEETNIKEIILEQFYTFGDKGRDPRGHTISVVFYGFLPDCIPPPLAGDDAAEIKWFQVEELPPMAFDHRDIICLFRKSLKSSNKIT